MSIVEPTRAATDREATAAFLAQVRREDGGEERQRAENSLAAFDERMRAERGYGVRRPPGPTTSERMQRLQDEQEAARDLRPPDELDRRREDAERRLGELEDERGRLALASLEATARAAVHKELDKVERAIAAARAELERIALARVAKERRDAETAQAARAAARKAARARMEQLHAERAEVAKAVDEGARAFAEALTRFVRLSAEQRTQAATAWAQDPSTLAPLYRSIDGHALLAYWFGQAGLPVGAFELDGTLKGWPRKLMPLAERFIQPEEGTPDGNQ